MDIRDLYWLAGWLEGEGSFLKAPPSRKCCLITAASTDEDVIKKVAILFGTKHMKEKRRKNAPDHWKDVYVTRVAGEPAIKIMQQLKPLMGTRRQAQIEQAIASNKSVNKRITEDQWIKVKDLLNQGKSLRQIEKETGVSRSSISINSTI